jgi:subtilisin family serine protease
MAAFASGSLNASAGHRARFPKLESRLATRAAAANASRKSTVIVTLAPGAELPSSFRSFTRGGKLDLINGHVLEVPDSMLATLAASAVISRVHANRPVVGANFRTAVTSGAFFVKQHLGYSGAGVGVAVLDSGVTAWHDDLTPGKGDRTRYPYGNQRVAAFVDFVNGRPLPYDDLGHGTHVAGTILGNGFDSRGQMAGVAPDASLISLKVLGDNGQGTESDVIAALNWVAANARRYNIRVVNVSLGAAVADSYWQDPLTLAAKALVDRGIVVVAASGNFGQDAAGHKLWGAVTAPGNAPWVLTVGASSTMGSVTRRDDTVAAFSSRGPTLVDQIAKPDLVASGVGTVSIAAAESVYYSTKSAALVKGSVPTAAKPYLSLSGTSVAAPVVSGTVALMLQANPRLTPNLVKAILMYTAQQYPGYRPLEEGAGFLNALGAVRLARFYATARQGQHVPVERIWSRQILWGNYRITGGLMVPGANAWDDNIVWGTSETPQGQNIVWGTSCGEADCGNNIVWGTSTSASNIVWGTADAGNIVWGTSQTGENIVWGTETNNIVWGTDCGGADCQNIVWGTEDDTRNIVWGTAETGDNIVWGTDSDENIVWGTSDGDNIVWGTGESNNIVWGTNDDDNIVWGTLTGDNNIVWGTDVDDNIVWGTDDDNIVWGTDDDNIVWGTVAGGKTVRRGKVNPPYGWFLRASHAAVWVAREFGDSFLRHGRGRR